MGLVVAGGFVGFWAAGAGLLLGLSPGAALGIWAGSGPVAAGVAMLASRSRGPCDQANPARPDSAGPVRPEAGAGVV